MKTAENRLVQRYFRQKDIPTMNPHLHHVAQLRVQLEHGSVAERLSAWVEHEGDEKGIERTPLKALVWL